MMMIAATVNIIIQHKQTKKNKIENKLYNKD